LFYINSFNLNAAIHCFGTMLKGGREGYTSHKSVSLARFPQNLQNLYRISGLRYLLKFCAVKLRELGYSQISAPLSAKLRQTPKSYRGARTCSMSSITMPSLVGLGFHPPPGRTKTLSFFCLFVSLFVTLLNIRVCAPNFTMNALEHRNDFDAIE